MNHFIQQIRNGHSWVIKIFNRLAGSSVLPLCADFNTCALISEVVSLPVFARLANVNMKNAFNAYKHKTYTQRLWWNFSIQRLWCDFSTNKNFAASWTKLIWIYFDTLYFGCFSGFTFVWCFSFCEWFGFAITIVWHVCFLWTRMVRANF